MVAYLNIPRNGTETNPLQALASKGRPCSDLNPVSWQETHTGKIDQCNALNTNYVPL
jgi:hypothetical protein